MMFCPKCFQQVQIIGTKVYCPTDKIYLSEDVESFKKEYPADQVLAQKEALTKRVEENTKQGEIKNRRKVINVLVISLAVIATIILIPLGFLYTYLHAGANGYREELFSNYSFTEKAKWYLRFNTLIVVKEPGNKHLPSYGTDSHFSYAGHTVVTGSENDQLTLHEITHAWWAKLYKEDPSIKRRIIDDTIKVAKETNPEYKNDSLFAASSLLIFCNCSALKNMTYDAVDADHLLVYWAVYTMGRFKDGERKLPPYMWTYLEGEFTGKPKIKTCYELNNCEQLKFDPSKAEKEEVKTTIHNFLYN